MNTIYTLSSHHSQAPVSGTFEEVLSFPSHHLIVDCNGQTLSPGGDQERFVIVSQHTRAFSWIERVCHVALFIFCSLISFGCALASKQMRDLLCQTHLTFRVALPIDQVSSRFLSVQRRFYPKEEFSLVASNEAELADGTKVNIATFKDSSGEEKMQIVKSRKGEYRISNAPFEEMLFELLHASDDQSTSILQAVIDHPQSPIQDVKALIQCMYSKGHFYSISSQADLHTFLTYLQQFALPFEPVHPPEHVDHLLIGWAYSGTQKLAADILKCEKQNILSNNSILSTAIVTALESGNREYAEVLCAFAKEHTVQLTHEAHTLTRYLVEKTPFELKTLKQLDREQQEQLFFTANALMADRIVEQMRPLFPRKRAPLGKISTYPVHWGMDVSEARAALQQFVCKLRESGRLVKEEEHSKGPSTSIVGCGLSFLQRHALLEKLIHEESLGSLHLLPLTAILPEGNNHLEISLFADQEIRNDTQEIAIVGPSITPSERDLSLIEVQELLSALYLSKRRYKDFLVTEKEVFLTASPSSPQPFDDLAGELELDLREEDEGAFKALLPKLKERLDQKLQEKVRLKESDDAWRKGNPYQDLASAYEYNIFRIHMPTQMEPS